VCDSRRGIRCDAHSRRFRDPDIGDPDWHDSVGQRGSTVFFFDPSKKNLSPSLPFRIYAVPLRKEDTE